MVHAGRLLLVPKPSAALSRQAAANQTTARAPIRRPMTRARGMMRASIRGGCQATRAREVTDPQGQPRPLPRSRWQPSDPRYPAVRDSKKHKESTVVGLILKLRWVAVVISLFSALHAIAFVAIGVMRAASSVTH